MGRRKTVQSLLNSYPWKPSTGIVVPCNNKKYYVRLRSIPVKEFFAIYVLYECSARPKFLPETVLSFCKIPETYNDQYENTMLAFLEQLSCNKDYFFKGKLYAHYVDEIKTLLEDLQEGGNQFVTREMAFEMWLRYRLLFRDNVFSTQSVVEANPVMCKRNNIIYAGPLLI